MANPSPAASSVSDPRRFSVGLTGGIGSGKSLVADLLAARGAAIVDTDAIAHRLTAAGGAAIAPIRAAFGAEFIDPQGALDRARMRARVFADGGARRALEDVLHPLIRAAAETDAAAAPREAPYVVFAVPLLVESGNWAGRVDRVLVIDCPVAVQVARVVRTRALAPTLVEAIVAQQASRAQRLAAADDVLINAGTTAQLPPRIARLHMLYCALALQQRAAAGAAGPL